MKTLTLTDKQAIRLYSILKYAYNKYLESESQQRATVNAMEDLMNLVSTMNRKKPSKILTS